MKKNEFEKKVWKKSVNSFRWFSDVAFVPFSPKYGLFYTFLMQGLFDNMACEKDMC